MGKSAGVSTRRGGSVGEGEKAAGTGGRPTEYRSEFAEQATKLCLLGATDAKLADFFEVSETTVNNWKIAHPGFLESIRAGKRAADAEVAHGLFNRARGAQYTTQQAFKVRRIEFDDKGKKKAEFEEVISIPVDVVEPPDTAACSLWLRNRDPESWRDKVEHAHSGEVISRVVSDL